MTRLVPLKPREVEKILLRNRFILNFTKGSHKQFFNPRTNAHATVPFHSKDMALGTLRSIIKQSQLSDNLFKR
ncbi:MAG: Toxin-antitoxin system, toxin component, HicA family [Candidatus Woesebacteria bacterium GW2011_GWA1_37_7]|uniref:Toxin-antitoxin system, toxin component, HicA family n=1 Tax=Candidatus Woesebacteria bacterium GW2011_GWA1_37_7 TaxID=1618545 RepID=A0A0G0HB28_9BACT|nr:MAG: Toxin-antitoxin system, toxin component, HicA family [Candidatus Woesebacteria bacterium GW2011_GWA1_37_7]